MDAKEPSCIARILTHRTSMSAFVGIPGGICACMHFYSKLVITDIRVSCDCGLCLLRSVAWPGCDLLSNTSIASLLAMAQTRTQH